MKLISMCQVNYIEEGDLKKLKLKKNLWVAIYFKMNERYVRMQWLHSLPLSLMHG
jgi:hypothetical protein